MRNIQRPADRSAETVLNVTWVFLGRARERIRGCIQGGVAYAVIDGAMRLVTVETAPAKTTAAKASSSETAASKTTSTKAAALLPGVIEALLHFVGAQRIKGTGSIPRNRNRLRRAVRRNSGDRHPGGSHITHGTARRILPGALKYGKTLKAPPGRGGLRLLAASTRARDCSINSKFACTC